MTVQVLGSRPVAGTLESSHDVVNGEASLVRELGPKFQPRADRTLRSVGSSVIKDYLDTGLRITGHLTRCPSRAHSVW